MEHEQLSKVSQQFKRTFSADTLNALGKEVRFCARERTITPHRLALGLIEVFAHAPMRTIADAHRAFNALCDETVQYKPFHNQLAKEQFPTFMRSLCLRLMERLSGEALQFDPASPFAQFDRIELQDGSSFALKWTLSDTFPGRFTRVSPAAVELHVTFDLLSEQPRCVMLTPDTDSEAQYLPPAEELTSCLLMADRGYFKKDYLAKLMAQDAFFIIKGKAGMNPTVMFAVSEEGRERTPWCGKPLRDIKPKFLKRQAMDMDVQWRVKGNDIVCRLIVCWNPVRGDYQYLLTNLERTEFSIEQILAAYRLRWQIELLFKEWKSYANLQGFDTNNDNIAEGLIWASLCAAILTRFCAHVSGKLTRVPISTMRVAACIGYVLQDVIYALIHRGRQLNRALRRLVDYLSSNAQRAHPERDRKNGRSKLGLQHVYTCP